MALKCPQKHRNHLSKNRTVTLFRYQAGNSAVHRLPAWIKLCALLPLSAIAFLLPPPALSGAILLTALCARFSGLSFRDQLYDLRAAAYYLGFLYWTDVISRLWRLGDLRLVSPAVF
ncbi:MAG: hypothetical protein LBS64_02445, partial [Spirochaetaceae bacterium]|nr:hypothetical protein [Spirochaetaceae bacterium]